MKRKFIFSADTLLIALGVTCLALAAMLALARPVFLIPVAAVVTVLLVLTLLFLRRIRRAVLRLLGGKPARDGAFEGLAALAMPVAVLQGKNVMWHNAAFAEHLSQGVSAGFVPIEKLAPGFNVAAAAREAGQDMAVGEKRFTVYSAALEEEKSMVLVVFIEDTALKYQAGEWQASRPSVLYFVIDTYDEILQEMRGSERAAIISNIDLALERCVGDGNAFLCRVSASRYLAVAEERYVQKILEGRFSILDEVRRSDEDASTVTMSVGVGRLGGTLKECEEWARQALDMALGRGGDQAAVKSPDGFEFYGGVSRSVEKRTKVKSRIIATAIRELMAQYDRVLVMGHRDSDMDSVGAAMGMLCFCRICKKPAALVVDREKTLAGSLLALMADNGHATDMLSPQQALPITGERTLLIVVDTHIHFLLESAEVYKNCGGVVVIDHHRRMVGHIDNALIFYHEPYASSTSELAAELLQYAGDGREDKPTQAEAEAMLAGITLDTRTFSLNVGVRTFEAAAWLRRMGAGTSTVKKLFASTMDEYLYRSHLVAEAHIHEGCAVALSARIPPEYEVVAPQAANELLGISGVAASFVGVLAGGEVRISARSMGEVNVQLVMEKIGGGGHLTMAGAQLKDMDLSAAEALLKEAITAYMAERAHA